MTLPADDLLLRRAVFAVRSKGRKKKPRWVLVKDAFMVGSTSATELCQRFGYDPEEVV